MPAHFDHSKFKFGEGWKVGGNFSAENYDLFRLPRDDRLNYLQVLGLCYSASAPPIDVIKESRKKSLRLMINPYPNDPNSSLQLKFLEKRLAKSPREFDRRREPNNYSYDFKQYQRECLLDIELLNTNFVPYYENDLPGLGPEEGSALLGPFLSNRIMHSISYPKPREKRRVFFETRNHSIMQNIQFILFLKDIEFIQNYGPDKYNSKPYLSLSMTLTKPKQWLNYIPEDFSILKDDIDLISDVSNETTCFSYKIAKAKAIKYFNKIQKQSRSRMDELDEKEADINKKLENDPNNEDLMYRLERVKAEKRVWRKAYSKKKGYFSYRRKEARDKQKEEADEAKW